MLETIKSNTDISRLFDQGKRYNAPTLSILVAQTSSQHDQNGRVAFVAGKRLGGAVWRNAAKRRMRELCRGAGGPWPGYDVVFIAKAGLLSKKYSTVAQHCGSLIQRAFNDQG